MNWKKIAIIGTAASLMLAGFAHGADKNTMISHNWQRHERGIEKVLDIWKRGGTDKEYANPLVKIISAECNLSTFGVSPLDNRFVSHLLNEDGARRPSKDVYRIFLKRFNRQTGWKPSRDKLYKGKTFRLSNKDNSHHSFTLISK